MGLKKFGVIAAGVLGISIVLTIHELGHYTAAQFFGIHTPEFSIGLGPVLFKTQLNHTTFALRAFPLGGYVKIEGAGERWNRKLAPFLAKSPNHFAYRPLYQKILVILAGIFFNILFAIVCFSIIARPKYIFTSGNRRRFIGPIGIINLIGQNAFYGLRNYVWFLAYLSINLAVFNFLPLPLLDGGKLLLYTVEELHGGSLPEIAYILLTIASIIFVSILFIKITTKEVTDL